MPFGPVLVGDGVVLRAPVDADLNGRRRLGRNADIRRLLGAKNVTDTVMTVAQARAWFARLGRDDAVEWVVEHEGAFLGTARLHSFAPDRRARYAIALLDPAQLGRGLGRIVTRLVVRYGFAELGLVAIDLLVLDFNDRAQRCYRACGFHEVERLPSGIIDGERPADDIRMAVTPGSFLAAG